MTTIAKKLAQIKPGTLLAGLDLGLPRRAFGSRDWLGWGLDPSLDSLTCVVLDAGGQRLDRFKARQSRDGYEYLHWRLAVRLRHPSHSYALAALASAHSRA